MNDFCPFCAGPLVVGDVDKVHVGTVEFCTRRCMALWHQDPLHDRRRVQSNVAINRRVSTDLGHR